MWTNFTGDAKDPCTRQNLFDATSECVFLYYISISEYFLATGKDCRAKLIHIDASTK
jgi:hypothetical protein